MFFGWMSTVRLSMSAVIRRTMNILVITDDYCLMAMVIFVNHFPVYVTLARGCEDSRNMLEGQYNEVIEFLRKHFGDTPVIFRADAGFVRESIVRGLVQKDAYYVIGYAPNRALQKYADTEWVPDVIKQYCHSAEGEFVLRALGEYEQYRPAKRTAEEHKNLRLILRDQYAPKPAITLEQKRKGKQPKEADLRCIITNIPTEIHGQLPVCKGWSNFSRRKPPGAPFRAPFFQSARPKAAHHY